ncbi:UDP-N-acetyl-D-mannosamine dehydrogenase [Pseudomonas sp. PA27(2017)]|uniref:UDP-N-acetyl-D-mannosamine dehydrogenase n=1 Tax=Pseudomonas sp. PA27(2017) TaxID=1932112 RepID=UPI000964F1A2|nr:UDP-N-acetyl-D-mannosamine dehydrogenase [Pseudomonas sp. PA27(2017)]OLU33083.1 UDP-N-acetyl-D-mannosamine dehydrogenase [Pseudomonas sp. PA27(2017)]
MQASKTKVSVVGLGYIGLPTAAVLASVGHDVIGVDVDTHVVNTVNRGETHIVEPDLDGLVSSAVSSGRLRATTTPEEADAFLIAVPTPFKEGKQPDLVYIEAAARALAPKLRQGNLVILESTSPVGATEKLSDWLKQERPDLRLPSLNGEEADIYIAYCPERVLPGSTVTELVKNDRVIGGMTIECAARARALYQTFVRGECILTDARTAEMTKLTENSFRDVNIAFANELSVICDELDINVWELITLANRHPRVNILKPGPGVGGHCIAVDPWFIVDSAPESARLIRTAREVNDAKPRWVENKIEQAIAEASKCLGRSIHIACLGLAFKPDIDDLRESPALEIAHTVIKNSPNDVLVVEPYIDTLPHSLSDSGKARLVDTATAIEHSDVLILLVDHTQFKTVDRASLVGKVVVDTRGAWT